MVRGNTYIQHIGGKIGQYGANREAEPGNMDFDMQAEEKISAVLGDCDASVYWLD